MIGSSLQAPPLMVNTENAGVKHVRYSDYFDEHSAQLSAFAARVPFSLDI